MLFLILAIAVPSFFIGILQWILYRFTDIDSRAFNAVALVCMLVVGGALCYFLAPNIFWEIIVGKQFFDKLF